MVLNQTEQTSVPIVKWIGAHDPQVSVTHLLHKNVFFYSKCIIGPLTLSVGDFVLVSNADASDPDTVDGCDIAKILHLYELREMSNRDPCRAIVQWYSRPECIPHKHFDNDDICVDFGSELIEEHRPYDSDISLETVFRKCSVICGPTETSAAGLLENFNIKTKSCPMFVCRYKFIKVKNSYRLVPLQFANEEFSSGRGRRKSTAESNNVETKSEPFKKSRRASVVASGDSSSRKRRISISTENTMEFVDLNYFNAENKVSPIKIVGGRSVVRLSAKKKSTSGTPRVSDDLNANYLPASPLAEQNVKVTPRSRAAAAKRNLNLSLDNGGADTTADSDCLNYSIVKGTPDPQQPPNDMKIKLRLSERRRSSRLASFEEDPLALGEHERHISPSKGHIQNDIYHTPTKKNKESSESTPSNRRKSILKSATSRMAEGTPKRSIQLSSIVEQRIFKDDEIISTPKRTKARKSIIASTDVGAEKDTLETKKSTQKTPTKGRRSITKSTHEETPGTPRTPSQKLKMIRSGEIKPTIEFRSSLTVGDTEKTELQIARERLHVSVVPKSLPCREKEFENIYTFLEGKIQDQCGGCMYVSGVPGTGKTATVTGVIRNLQKKVSEDDLPPFDFLEINGMRLTEPRQAYVHIYRQLTGKTLSWEHAHTLLEKRFTTPAPRRVTTVLLVDELDILCNRRQDVVYNLLDWPTKSAARLVVVTIANTMDLPERLLMGKVTSRLGLTRLTFQPYTHKQLQEIVTGRLSGSEAFKGDAVQLVARKVAAVSGDARRALDICRRATEIADAAASKAGPNGVQCVNMLHVQQALAEMIASAKVQAIKNCSRLEQIFLQAVVAEVNRTGVEETSFSGVYSQIETIAAFMGASIPTPGRALQICSKLGAERLIISEHSRNDIFQKILLNVSMDDIHYALKVNN
ncbi:Origin recognition complex subunit 1 [Lucilia cuprina]|uniref:Origin recognition complex subunit 1 n=1 Tax=Lucilia cuprina TaxID=7375 RepID=A0A0L0CG01_LUCCU|nr:Origin recognition complex subunit 1 [Lucilia cuprina]KNC31147.1 Origin recognition complex subunit 1 [Lucilia cuprina]